MANSAGAVIGLIAEPLLAWLELVAARFAELPGAVAVVSLPGPAAVAAAYVALIGFGVAALRIARRGAPYADELLARSRVASRRALAAGALTLIAALARRRAGRVVSPAAPDRLTVSFLDVGQGDATLVQHPDGSAVLFDGGPAEARVARLLKQAGVRHLSAVVATHASADHHGGLVEVIRRFPVDLLLDGGDGTSDPEFRRVVAEAAPAACPSARRAPGSSCAQAAF